MLCGLPVLSLPNQTVLVHTIRHDIVEYKNSRYKILKVLGSSAQWYDDSDYFIHFDDKGIVFEAVEFIPSEVGMTLQEMDSVGSEGEREGGEEK